MIYSAVSTRMITPTLTHRLPIYTVQQRSKHKSPGLSFSTWLLVPTLADAGLHLANMVVPRATSARDTLAPTLPCVYLEGL